MNDFPWHVYGWRGWPNRIWKSLGGEVEIHVGLELHESEKTLVRGLRIASEARGFVAALDEVREEDDEDA